MTNGESNGTALVYAPPMTALTAYEPRDIREARELAKMYAESRLIKDVGTEQKAMLIMATGAEIGISATAALRSIHIIGDRPCLSAQLKIALVIQRKDLCKYFRCTESTEEKATYETLRVGDVEPMRVTFTIDDAKRMLGAGRVDDKDGNWFKVRRRMLRWRAGSELADFMYPEVTLGLPSSEEMADEIIDMKPAPLQLDSNLVGAAAAVAGEAAQKKEERAEERREEAAGGESVEDAFKRWQGVVDVAVTLAECDKVGTEIKKRFEKESPEYERGKKLVSAAKDRLKNAHKQPPKDEPKAPAQQQMQMGDVPIDRERQPGEDG